MSPATLTEAAWETRLAHFGNRMHLYAPLYFSNDCVNDCLYCNFRISNKKLSRTKLSVPDVLSEARAIRDKGITRITLVTGELPWEKVGNGILEVVDALREEGLFEYISGNFGALPDEAYSALAKIGLDSYQIFQETYDLARYTIMHPRGPKHDFAWRWNTPFRALRAGIPSVGMGFLGGLAPVDEEAMALEEHVRKVQKEFPHGVSLLNFPRLQYAPGAEIHEPPFPIPDDDFLELLVHFRVSFPTVGIALTTRESPALRDRAIGAGITHMSVESHTTVGGYAKSSDPGEGQFFLGDHRSQREICKVLSQRGLYCSPHPGFHLPVPVPD